MLVTCPLCFASLPLHRTMRQCNPLGSIPASLDFAAVIRTGRDAVATGRTLISAFAAYIIINHQSMSAPLPARSEPGGSLATRASIGRNRTAFAAMLRAVRRMQAWLQEHSADELAALVAPFFPSLAEDLLVSSLRRYHDAGLWATCPEISREGFARLAASLFSGGFVSRVHSYDDCVDQSLY
jgi:ABC-type nitrate/sulfonate/bicarbonate transport system substrate-binding protein